MCISGMVPSLLLVGFTTNYNTALLLIVIAASSRAAVMGATHINIQDITPNHSGVVFDNSD